MDAAQEELEKVDIHDEETDVICDNCGRHMVIKYGPHGRFLACPGFPECRNTKPYYEKIGVACPKCGKEAVSYTHLKFVTQRIADYFNSKSWYKGTVEPETFDADTSVFNEYEVANIQKIADMEGKLRSEGK